MKRDEALAICGGKCPDCQKIEPLMPYSRSDATPICAGCAMKRMESGPFMKATHIQKVRAE